MAELTMWVRRGDCNHCGACCQAEGVIRIVEPLQGTDHRYYEVRGYDTTSRPGYALAIAHATLPCPQHNTAAGRCNIWHERPRTCRFFPERPAQIEGFGQCSYWFELVTVDGTVLARRGGPGSPYPTAPEFGGPGVQRGGAPVVVGDA